MIANCPECMTLVVATEFTVEQKRAEQHANTNRERLFSCPKCKKYWYGGGKYPRGNILEAKE